MARRLCIVFTVLMLLLMSSCPAFAQGQGKDELKNAVWLYEHENYEEALAILKKLQQENPGSSLTAYYLGITYKQLQDFTAARPHLEAAAVLEPKVKNAIPELIDVLYQCNEFEEAKRWIEVAERESIAPAQIAFLKGLVLAKEGKDPDAAIAAFDLAATLDKGLENAALFQKALIQVQARRLSAAKDIFQNIVTREPSSDMAAFANEYLSAITRKEEAAKPFHASVGAALNYDDNVVQKPHDESLTPALDKQADWRSTYTLQANYLYKPTEQFGARAGYSLYYGKQFDIGFYDTASHDVSLQPAIYYPRAAIMFPVHYNYVTLDDRKYLGVVGVGNVNNFMMGKNQMAQCSVQYNHNDYAWEQTNQDEDRSGGDYLGSLGWYRFFAKNQEGFVNVRYALDSNNTKGDNWRSLGNRVAVVTTIPLIKKVKLSVGGDYYNQDYRKTNSIFNEDRKDNIFTLSNLLSVEIFKNASFELQYTYVSNKSTIDIYTYTRDVFSAGVKYQF